MPTFNSTKILGDLKTTGEIQNNSIWINDGTNYNSYNENIRLFTPSGGSSAVIGFNATGTSGTPVTSILGFSDRLETRIGNDWLTRQYSSNLQISSRTDVHYAASTGGGQNRFNGIYAPSVSNGRAQLVLSSSYSDLVIASSQANNSHGSTLTFASYNPSNASDYRKFVVNQGNWGSRYGFLDFGYASNNENPHTAISSTNTAFTIDGVNKRVGIGVITPAEKLDVAGNIKTTGNLLADGSLYLNYNNSAANSYVFFGDAASDNAHYLQFSDATQKFTLTDDLIVTGNVTVNGSFTMVDTNTSTTEQWNVTNDGTGPAVTINQTGSQPIMDVQDDGTTVFKIVDGGNVEVSGDILLTGTATTTNQGRLIDFTGFDKEGATDFSDRAYIQHTTNTGGHTGSVLVISSQNDSGDGIAFQTNGSSQLKHNSHVIWDAGNDGASSGLDADLLDGVQGSGYYRYYPVTAISDYNNVSAGAWSTTSSTATNIPYGNYNGTWHISDTTNDRQYQLWMGDTSAGGLRFRAKQGSTNGWHSWEKVWTDVNDGSGSGLDADKLDGVQGSSFLRSDATDTATGQLYLTNHTNHYNGHHYFDPYDANGNHYPHYSQGSNNNGAQVNMRVQDQNGTYQVFYIDGDSNNMTWRGHKIWNAGNDGSGSGLDADTVDGIQAGSFLRSDATDLYTPARLDLGSTGNWDAVGYGNQTNLHFRDHNQFWIGAGNGTWFTGTANTKSQASGLAADASAAHDLLITTMQSTSTYDRGITFAVDSNAGGTAGWRLGKWHSGTSATNSMLAVNGQIHAKGGHTDSTDYYADDYSTYHSTGNGAWPGDTNAGWHKPSIVAAKAIQIQSGTGATNSSKPQIQFHQYGYGGPGIEYDGPNKTLTIGELGSSTSNRLDNVNIKTVNNLQVNGNTVWHAGNDGSGSGLDADKLDNIDSGSFLRSDTADTATGQITASGKLVVNTNTNTNNFYISRGGSTSQEYTSFGRDDTVTHIHTKNDESSSTVRFRFENTDTESNGGANANDRNINFISDPTDARILIDGDKVFHDGYHPNADKWTTARTITLGGDLTGNVSIDGSANVTLSAQVVDDSHNHTISNVDGLQAALDDKAEVTYTSGGTTSDVSTLNFNLNTSTKTLTITTS